MEVDPVPSTSNDKGKQPEVAIPPVTNYGEDESFDTTENLLGTNGNNNIINFAREDDSPLFFAYCACEKFFSEHTNKEKINLTNEIFNGPHLPSFIGASVRPHPDNKQMKIIRIGFSTRADFDRAITMQITQLGNETFQPLVIEKTAKFTPELSIKITEIPISTPAQNIRSSFSYFGKITRCTMTTKNLWQQATLTFEEGTDMSQLDQVHGYFVLKDMVRVHRCTLENVAIREKSKFSLKLTNLPKDTNGRQLIPIAKAVNATAFVIPKSKATYRNLQYAVFYFKNDDDRQATMSGDTIFLDRKRLIWTDPASKLCFICSVPGHRSDNCRKARQTPKDRQTQNLYQRYQPAQFKNYTAPSKPVSKSISFAHMTNNGKKKVPETPRPQPKKILPRPPINNIRSKGENSLNTSIHAPNDWADESEYLHPNPKGYPKPINDINDHEQPDRMDLLMTKLDAVSTQLVRPHEDLQFTNERVSTIESLLKIYSTSPKQAAIINAQLSGETMEEENFIVQPGIDISESV